MITEINAELATKVLSVIDAGLVAGIGQILIEMKAPGTAFLYLTE